ncbi:Glutamate--tRNA ligase 1 [Caulifigura coniformis]|uniref:Glutamyl-Q tRNA(Asp) synthetase n=1 Tax=Caulifigura coniformis TaxID=2527983 RepID=A0A517SL64_9PLAN|nr:tRNA glutamyl-Q(34) synthetase GluQRS [Caulifigura coniformis]QDT56860.1 Glutamate--tRNA ligase 1 [Caulifigura coniformis]
MVGRLAPSPTGAQHVGNARTFLLAWLSARSQNGSVVFRLEDIDSPRVKAWAAQQALDDLRWLGLDWDFGPDVGGPDAPYNQTQRQHFYAAALEQLKTQERVYPCTCSRSDVEAAASAPHAGQEGPRYPGTCAHRRAGDAAHLAGRPFSWRFRMSGTDSFDDSLQGPQSQRLDDLGDFIIAKSDGSPAYQLAVVLDDEAMGVTEVVRGDDLLPSAFRQRAIARVFGLTSPTYAHIPLVIGPDGRRLAKRHGDTRISVLREQGVSPERLIGRLAHSVGLTESVEPITASKLVSGFHWSRISRESLVWTMEDWRAVGGSGSEGS